MISKLLLNGGGCHANVMVVVVLPVTMKPIGSPGIMVLVVKGASVAEPTLHDRNIGFIIEILYTLFRFLD